jgi:hypothetical protein
LKSQRPTVQCCAADHSFLEGQVYPMTIAVRLFLIRKVVAMLAEIFIVRSEAEVRLVDKVLPSSTSCFIQFSPTSQFVFKQPDLTGEEARSERPPIGAVTEGRRP